MLLLRHSVNKSDFHDRGMKAVWMTVCHMIEASVNYQLCLTRCRSSLRNRYT